MKKATFWVSKNSSNEYFPLSPEYVNFDSESGCVTDITEALGEFYENEELLLSAYKRLDRSMKSDGVKNGFTTNLLKYFEPKIIELTDEQYSRWMKNLSNE